MEEKKPANAFVVPQSLATQYKAEPEPTELEVLRALQGEGMKDYAIKMIYSMWPNRAVVDEKVAMEQAKHPDFHKFVAHRMKLDSAYAKVMEAKNKRDSEEAKARNDARMTCPVCGEVAWFNTSSKPCKLCVVAIETKLAATKTRESAVDKWLKSHTYDWVRKS